MSTLFTNFFKNINQIRPLEADFTEVLDAIALKPRMLYFYGKMPENVAINGKKTRPKTVAIVGSRHNTKYGEEIAYKMAYELAKRGVVIVSGLAYGIDSISHRATLEASGTTIAVLGTPINDIYPKSHQSLAKEIIEKGGAILSEYAPRTPEFENSPLAIDEYLKNGKRSLNYKSTFLHRNRLISGLSDIIVVVEAADHSGTLNTAAHALNQGKDVFAVPGNITNPYSRGCNSLIKQGATPYTEPEELLKILFPEDYRKKSRKKNLSPPRGDTEVETKILEALFKGLRRGEEIMDSLDLPSPSFNEAITLLEIKGLVRSLGLNNWSLS